MEKFQNLTHRLLAAGSALHPEGKGVYLLSVDPDKSFLVSKYWVDGSFQYKDLVATSIRPNSSVACLVNPSTQYVVCINTASCLRILRYHEDEDEWKDLENIPLCKVHPKGKVCASLGTDNQIRVAFQDENGFLVCLDTSMNTVGLLATPMEGSPITMAVIDNQICVFYVSTDGRIHYAVEKRPGNWKDNIFSKGRIDEELKQFILEVGGDNGGSKVYALTEGNTLLEISGERKIRLLGRVDETGKFISERKVDRLCNDAWDGTLTRENLKDYLASDPEVLNSVGGDISVTPLAAACSRGQLNVVKLLLEEGADPNALSPKNRPPLFYATARSPSRNRVEIVRALIDKGAKVDERNEEDGFNTPLMYAIAVASDQEVVRELIDKGASLDIKNEKNETARMMASGTVFEAELPKPRVPSPWEVHVINFITALIALIVHYTKAEDVFVDVIEEVVAGLGKGDDSNENAY